MGTDIYNKIRDKRMKSFIKKLEHRKYWFMSLSDDEKRFILKSWYDYRSGKPVSKRRKYKRCINVKPKVEHFYKDIVKYFPGDPIKIRDLKINEILKS